MKPTTQMVGFLFFNGNAWVVKVATLQVLIVNKTKSKQFEIQIPAIIDFDPDTLNLQSKGEWVTVYIELPKDYNVSEINISTVTLNDTVKADPSAPSAVGDYNSNRIPDLMVKFNRAEVVDYILSKGVGQENVTLTVNGELFNGAPFTGSNIIRIKTSK